MLFKEALEITNRLTPNMYSEEDRRRWLMLAEEQIWKEIILTHKGACCMPKPTGEDDSELLAPDQFAEDLYVNFLQARIAKENLENVKYNQSITLYNDAFRRFSAWYNERHMPIGSGVPWRI